MCNREHGASEQKHPGGRSRLAAMFNSVAEFAFRGCAAASPLPLSIRPPCKKESTVSLGRGRGRSLSLHLWVAVTHLELLADFSLVGFQLAPASIIFAISKAFHCWHGDFHWRFRCRISNSMEATGSRVWKMSERIALMCDLGRAALPRMTCDSLLPLFRCSGSH